ncbi:PPC domain-containing protein [Deinococcus radiopugnans]|uniref:PPC domain-containing protein n=1 Tax=Deinococcus radiopugnans TaxID=57497 RepID=UPI00068957AB|nr:PPC domain-containing protein [Deinococcus radiopugnans]
MPPKSTPALLPLALSAVLAACTDLPVPAVPGTESEPNDSAATANLLTPGTPLDGRIAGQPRDVDYFKFSAEAGARLKLTVSSVSVDPGSTLDPYAQVLLPDGFTVLEHDDDSGGGLESELRFNVTRPGTYYVTVTSFDIHDDEQASDDRERNTYRVALTRR